MSILTTLSSLWPFLLPLPRPPLPLLAGVVTALQSVGLLTPGLMLPALRAAAAAAQQLEATSAQTASLEVGPEVVPEADAEVRLEVQAAGAACSLLELAVANFDRRSDTPLAMPPTAADRGSSKATSSSETVLAAAAAAAAEGLIPLVLSQAPALQPAALAAAWVSCHRLAIAAGGAVAPAHPAAAATDGEVVPLGRGSAADLGKELAEVAARRLLHHGLSRYHCTRRRVACVCVCLPAQRIAS